jgi:hypothetical protein
MKTIINSAWNLDAMDTMKLAKYMRCLFQVAISDSGEIAEQLLDQVHSIAADAEEVCYSVSKTLWCTDLGLSRQTNHIRQKNSNG